MIEQKKKVLILYTSHTLGHKSIAENIGYFLSEDGHEVKLVDALEAERTGTVSIFLKLHTFINIHLPFIWRWAYLWGYIFLMMPFRGLAARWHSQKILDSITSFNPDMVITTQTSPSAVVSYLKSKGLYSGLFGIGFSDFHFHRAWMYKGADFYIANTLEQKQELIQRGIIADTVFVCGVTVRPKINVNIQRVRQRFGINEHDKVILIGSGSLGVRLPINLIKMFEEIVVDKRVSAAVHVVIVCGRNQQLRQQLEREIQNPYFQFLGFYQPMDELYALADLYVSKPGGLSVIESLLWNVPMFVTHILPGQEELNLHYLSERKLVDPLYVKPAKDWKEIIINDLVNGYFRKSLINNKCALDLVRLSNGTSIKQAVAVMFHR